MKTTPKHQIVIVDDDPDYTYLIEEAINLCNLPCKLTSIHSGPDLLNWLETNQRPNLIFLDINMPITTGFDMLKTLKTVDRYKAIPVVMLTVSASTEDVTTSYKHGANAYITKPVKFDALVPCMESLSHYWFDISRTPDAFWSNADNYPKRK